ncbi:potassium channel family protein [Halovivax limisalsi]|uniref:potassium channel family protein n=1 Tax=Halovivax limisalsi TaxID=1453760 RepID=UPI001FFD8FA8|nr:TrkA C-terminal domain-containing protein [Halovivax limisalsi]
MDADLAADVVIGLYLGVLTSIFPALIAFALGFVFKYVTGVTVPGLGVVVLGGGLAGISGGLLGLLDPAVAGTPAGITALLVVLMVCLWAHSIGDTLGARLPRRLTLSGLRGRGLAPDLAEHIDRFGQIRLRPIGEVESIEGYPPLPAELREALGASTWTLPADRSLSELETELAEQISSEFDVAEVSVSVDRRGHVELAAAPATAGLSRSIRPGHRAVTVRTLLPTGLARGDEVALTVGEDETVTGAVVGAQTDDDEPGRPNADTDPTGRPPDEDPDPPSERDTEPEAPGDRPIATPSAGTTTGGRGQVSVSLPAGDAGRILASDAAKLTVRAGGSHREFALVSLLQRAGNRFERISIAAGSDLDGVTIDEAAVRDAFEVAILSIRRAGQRIVGPAGDEGLRAGDEVLVVGNPPALDRFEEAVA